jgi:cytochrome c553
MAGTLKRRLLIGLAAIVGALILMAATLTGLSNRTLSRRFEVTPAPIVIPTDSASIERGRHLGTAITKCVECHGEDLGGVAMDLGPMGTFPAANLTSGRGGRQRSDADWVRAIHHGVGDSGRALVFMPALPYSSLGPADLGAIIAWVKSMPPVDRELPPLKLGPIGRMMIATRPGRLVPAVAINHTASFPADLTPAPTAEYGRYITVVGGCTYCHGDDLAGGIKEGPPGTPASADLRPDGPTARWSETDFITALRTGNRPDGSALNPFMPWQATRLMTDEEIRAVWLYLRSLK